MISNLPQVQQATNREILQKALAEKSANFYVKWNIYIRTNADTYFDFLKSVIFFWNISFHFSFLNLESGIPKLAQNVIWYVCLNLLSVYFYPQKRCYALKANYSLLGLTMLYMLTGIWMVRKIFVMKYYVIFFIFQKPFSVTILFYQTPAFYILPCALLTANLWWTYILDYIRCSYAYTFFLKGRKKIV